jgi:replication factor A1
MASGLPNPQTLLILFLIASGRSLSLLSSGSLAINPDVPEAHALKGWWMDGGSQTPFSSHTQTGSSSGSGGSINRNEIRTIHQVKEDQLGMSDKADFFSLRATIMHIKADNISYPACPTPQCNKKVTETHEGWRCEKCDRCHEKPEYRSVRSTPHHFIDLVILREFACRYIIQTAVSDPTGQMWLSGFNEIGNALFGKTGNELRSIMVSSIF